METQWQTMDISGIHLSVQTTVQEVPAGAWSPGEQPGALYCSALWFRLAEALGTGLRYIVASKAGSGSALAVLPVLLDPPRPGGSYDLLPHLLAPALGSEAGLVGEQRYLLGGSWNSNLALLSAMNIGLLEVRQAVLSALLRRCERMAAEMHYQGISLPFLLTDTAEQLATLVEGRGFFVRTAPTTWIHLHGQTFDELLASFSRKSRKNIRRELRMFQAGGAEIWREPPGERGEELADLIVQQKMRHAGSAQRVQVCRMLAAQQQVFGEQALTLCVRRQGQLIAATSLIVSHSGLYARSFGRAYASDMQHMEYFMAGYYEPFRYCMEHNLQWYHTGPQAYEAKVRRGLELVPLWTLFLPVHPPTAGQQAAVQRWNNRVLDQWQHWFTTTRGEQLPPSWRALNQGGQ
jgi:predicted N-acyltransferase